MVASVYQEIIVKDQVIENSDFNIMEFQKININHNNIMYVLRLKQVFGQWKVSEFCHPFTVGTMDIDLAKK